MPKLSKSDIERRAKLVKQELRIVNGGNELKNQLKGQIRDLHKAQVASKMPNRENFNTVINALMSQIDLINDARRKEDLLEMEERSDYWLQGSTKNVNETVDSHNGVITKKSETWLSKDRLQPNHLTLPLLPHLIQDEDEMFYELACAMSELDEDLKLFEFIKLFLACGKVYIDSHGTIDGFAERLESCVKEHKELLSSIFKVFNTTMMQELSQRLLETSQLKVEEK